MYLLVKWWMKTVMGVFPSFEEAKGAIPLSKPYIYKIMYYSAPHRRSVEAGAFRVTGNKLIQDFKGRSRLLPRSGRVSVEHEFAIAVLNNDPVATDAVRDILRI